MDHAPEARTSATLLGRLRRSPADEAAWCEFVDRYGRMIYRWCLRWKLQQVDAEDVTQIVLLKLADKMRTFVYDRARSFRAWLKTVTHHAWQDYADTRRRFPPGAGGSWPDEALHSAEAREDLVEHLQAERPIQGGQQVRRTLAGLAAGRRSD